MQNFRTMKDIEDRKDICLLVDSFYARVNEDPDLGPVFNEVMKVDWDKHLPKMYDFWHSIVFQSASYRGNPMQAHINVHKMSPLRKPLFDRWLSIFCSVVDKHFKGPLANTVKVRAESIATVIQIKLAETDDFIIGKGDWADSGQGP